VVALLPVRRLHRCAARARPRRAADGARRRRGARRARARAGLFIFGYCFYYYFARSEMSGFMQTAFYFGYMLMARPRPPPTAHIAWSPARLASVGLSQWVTGNA